VDNRQDADEKVLVGPFEFDGSTCRVVGSIDPSSTQPVPIESFDSLALLWRLPAGGGSSVDLPLDRALRTVAERYPFALNYDAETDKWLRFYEPVIRVRSILAEPTPLATLKDVASARRLTRFGVVQASVHSGADAIVRAEASYWGIVVGQQELDLGVDGNLRGMPRPNVWQWAFAEAAFSAWLTGTQTML